jgi:hypothetical protein
MIRMELMGANAAGGWIGIRQQPAKNLANELVSQS